MNQSRIQKLIQQGEGGMLEFKKASRELPRNFFETVCAFLNTEGGVVLLGVSDDGEISGVSPDAVNKIKSDIANLSNNPNKLDPPYLLFPYELEMEGGTVVSVQVPSSSQVHRTKGNVFLRSEDGDYKVHQPEQIAGIVNRKLSFFTEQRVFPYLTMKHFRKDLLSKSRKIMLVHNPRHPWANLSDEELLMKAGFVRDDVLTGQKGFTLAAGLMFGTDELIQSIAPAYKFDALLRRHDLERYDDRLIVRTNLIDAYDLLMGFVEKHLDDPFHLEGAIRVSLRSKIFRELVANIIAHREYTSAGPATMIIYRDRVEFKNPNIPHGQGPIDPENFTPYPKNPTICKFMIQLGRYEELGSGVLNVNRYLPLYADGAKPRFIEGDMFVTVAPLKSEENVRDEPSPYEGDALKDQFGQEVTPPVTPPVAPPVTPPVAPPVTPPVKMMLKLLEKEGESGAAEIRDHLGLKDRTYVRENYIAPALDLKVIAYTIPEKPTSRLQKYRLTRKGRNVLSMINGVNRR